MSFLQLKTIQRPTAIHSSIKTHFTDPLKINLIVSLSTCLNIYTLFTKTEKPETKKRKQIDEKEKAKLLLECCFDLQGKIVSMESVKLKCYPTDCLILTFVEAKISILRWDHSTQQPILHSMHCFERDQLSLASRSLTTDPIIKVDKEGRCGAMVVYDRYLALIPFAFHYSTQRESANSSTKTNNNFLSSSSVLKNKSNSFLVSLKELKVGVVRHLLFLEGYHEPTLLIMHEEKRTWAGRALQNNLTCSLCAISFNLAQRAHPIVWSAKELPFDTKLMFPIGEPLGGVLIFSANYIFYVNQTSKHCLGLNQDAFIHPPILQTQKQEDLQPLEIQSIECCLLNSNESAITLLISIQTGALYFVHLLIEGRNVSQIRLTKAGTTVYTSSLCVLNEKYLFFGSKLGDSMLVCYTHSLSNQQGNQGKIVDSLEQSKMDESFDDLESIISVSTKKAKITADGTNLEKENIYLTKAEELQMFKTAKNKQLDIYQFSRSDVLVNIGPINHFIANRSLDSASVSNSEYAVKQQSEIVACTGFDETGCVSIIQTSVRPDIFEAFQLGNDCCGCWSLKIPKQKKSVENDDQHFDSYLIISKQDSTTVYSTAEEINSIESQMNTKHPTLYVSNLNDNKLIVQICPNLISIFNEKLELIETKQFEVQVKHFSVNQRFIVILHQDKSFSLFTIEKDNKLKKLQLCKQIEKEKHWTCVYLFSCNVSKVRCFNKNFVESKNKLQTLKINPPKKQTSKKPAQLVDDIESLFSTTTNKTAEKSSKTQQNNNSENENKTNQQNKNSNNENHNQEKNFICLGDQFGGFSIFELNEKQTNLSKNVFYSQFIGIGAETLFHQTEKQKQQNELHSKHEQTFLKEITVELLGPNQIPHLICLLSNKHLFIYKSFLFFENKSETKNQNDNQNTENNEKKLPIRFKKVKHSFLRQTTKNLKKNVDEKPQKNKLKRNKIKVLEKVSKHKKVIFIGGKKPCWIFSGREHIEIHPMDCDGPIKDFTSFHNINCKFGFVYLTTIGSYFKIGQLYSDVIYDLQNPVRKIGLHLKDKDKHLAKPTPRFICFHEPTKTYQLILTRMSKQSILESNQGPLSNRKDDDELRMFNGSNWSFEDSFQLNENEVVLQCKVLNLTKSAKFNKKFPFVCIATGTYEGEDSATRGRILVFDVIPAIVKEEGVGGSSKSTKNKLHLLAQGTQKGPVSGLNESQGRIAVGVVSTVLFYQLEENELVGKAFYDCRTFISSLGTINNYVSVTDAYSSIQFLAWRDDIQQLQLVSSDCERNRTVTTNFVVDGQNLSMACIDENENLRMYAYEPCAESRDGKMLMLNAACYLGNPVLNLESVQLNMHQSKRHKLVKKCQQLLQIEEQRRKEELDFQLNLYETGKIPHPPTPLAKIDIEKEIETYISRIDKIGLVLGSLDGSISILFSVGERNFRRLEMLCLKMNSAVPHFAGLNPKSFRKIKMEAKGLNQFRTKRIVDSNLLNDFLHLNSQRQKQICDQIRTPLELVYESLIQGDYETSIF